MHTSFSSKKKKKNGKNRRSVEVPADQQITERKPDDIKRKLNFEEKAVNGETKDDTTNNNNNNNDNYSDPDGKSNTINDNNTNNSNSTNIGIDNTSSDGIVKTCYNNNNIKNKLIINNNNSNLIINNNINITKGTCNSSILNNVISNGSDVCSNYSSDTNIDSQSMEGKRSPSSPTHCVNGNATNCTEGAVMNDEKLKITSEQQLDVNSCSCGSSVDVDSSLSKMFSNMKLTVDAEGSKGSEGSVERSQGGTGQPGSVESIGLSEKLDNMRLQGGEYTRDGNVNVDVTNQSVTYHNTETNIHKKADVSVLSESSEFGITVCGSVSEVPKVVQQTTEVCHTPPTITVKPDKLEFTSDTSTTCSDVMSDSLSAPMSPSSFDSPAPTSFDSPAPTLVFEKKSTIPGIINLGGVGGGAKAGSLSFSPDSVFINGYVFNFLRRVVKENRSAVDKFKIKMDPKTIKFSSSN